MKRFSAFVLLFTIILSISLFGCKKDQPVNYQVNSENIINIGVLLPDNEIYRSSGQKVLEGINFANVTAQTINIDKEYTISLIVRYESQIQNAYEEFIDNKVSAVIAYGGDSYTTDLITHKFADTDIPVIFTDNWSKSIADTDNVFSISASHTFEASALAGYISEQGYKKGALVKINNGQDLYQDFSEVFSASLEQNFGITLTTYEAEGKKPDYNAESIAAGGYEFVCVYADTVSAASYIEEMKEAGVKAEFLMGEVTDKTLLENDAFEGVSFLSKFEYDDENYIGSDFINVYSDKMTIPVSDNNAAIAYGYDAYVLVYEALKTFSTTGNDLLGAVGNAQSATEAENVTISITDMLNAFKNITCYGVTDEIKFDETGLNSAEFIYVDTIQSQKAMMMKKYSYK